jgi:hypothetical protein
VLSSKNKKYAFQYQNEKKEIVQLRMPKIYKKRTDHVLERSRQTVADFVDGGVDGGFRLVVLQVGVHRLHDQLTQGARRASKIFSFSDLL